MLLNKIYNSLSKRIVAISIICFLLLLSITSLKIFLGNFPFWYDPGRDLLLGLDNLKKITLIGPPTGIPGIFYGPYWVWLISIAQLINKDPRFVLFLVSAVPYFTIFSIVFYKFKKVFPKNILFIIFFLFLYNFTYYTQIWNPYLAPILYLTIVYSVIIKKFGNNLTDFLRFIIIGLLLGLLINVHVSFGIGILLALIFYIFYIFKYEFEKNFINVKNRIIYLLKILTAIFSGLFLSFIPNLIFELRHNFLQTKAILFTLKRSIIENSSVVGQQGLSSFEIVGKLFSRNSLSLGLNENLFYLLIIIFAALILKRFEKKEIQLSESQKRLSLFLTFCLFITLIIYLSSKNPIWDYHFIAFEIICLLFIGLWSYKNKLFEKILLIWVLLLIVFRSYGFINDIFKSQAEDNYKNSKQIVELIYKDSEGKTFNYYAYNSAIYTYDFDYIFRWLNEEKYHNLSLNTESDLVYLIIPKIDKKTLDSFVSYKTPEDRYEKLYEWKRSNGYSVIKKVRN